MTNDLFSRSEVVKILENIEIGKFNRVNVIETIKSISTEERPQNKWKLIKENEYENDVNGEYYINTYACPSCNWKVRTEGEMEYRFCPMCGEDLRGK